MACFVVVSPPSSSIFSLNRIAGKPFRQIQTKNILQSIIKVHTIFLLNILVIALLTSLALAL